MYPEETRSDDDAALTEGCCRLDSAALAALAGLDCRHPAAEGLIQSSFLKDVRARKALVALVTLAPDCAVAKEWQRRRKPEIDRWILDFDREKVRPIVARTLFGFAGYVEDAVQEFWLSFICAADDLAFKWAEDKRGAYIGVIAFRRATDFLRALYRRRDGMTEAPDDADIQSQPIESDWSGCFERRLHRMILTNALRPEVAVVLLAREWAGFTTALLLSQYGDQSLFQLCEGIRKAPLTMKNRFAQDTIQLLIAQLSLPPETPAGSRTLAALATDSSGSPAFRLQGLIDSGRRTCLTQLDLRDDDCRSKSCIEVERAVTRDLTCRLDFAIRTVEENTNSLRILIWGLRKILNLKPSFFLALPATDAAQIFIGRMRWLMPSYPIPEQFPEMLLRNHQSETLGSLLAASSDDPEKVADAMHRKFLEFQRKRGDRR